MTPSGRPASRRILYVTQLASTDELAGFHTTVLPSTAGVDVRFEPMAAKLNGDSAKMKPSSGRYSVRFHVRGAWAVGCVSYSSLAKWQLKRQKSMDSAAASISACLRGVDH